MNLSSKGIYIILRICFKAWFLLNLVKDMRFANKILCYITSNLYICTVFFMVLDVRLTIEIGCP